ncbi:hypothetical protein GOP47_0015569 [Adiantum capillus-veneris]|uniref:THAP4-like heme-binding domain-containing protein n=1 Tax=Adiantum capillus-veneris TaxID=13818 RepID=A0A9D4UJW0_ADICA|nr:hypothetical protein GOP47_0015569 [Adiantum capillus-veneris]
MQNKELSSPFQMTCRLQKPANAISGKGVLANDWSSSCVPILGQLWLAARFRSKHGHALADDSAHARDVQHSVCKGFFEGVQRYWSSVKKTGCPLPVCKQPDERPKLYRPKAGALDLENEEDVGQGGFPTIQAFDYGEEIQFWHSGKPVMAYAQKTWRLSSGEPMHAESGYWRPKIDGSLEVIIAQSTGLAEVQKGTYNAENKSIALLSEIIANASKVKGINRSFTVVGDDLEYTVSMATNTHSLHPHLRAVLKRVAT